MNRKMPLYTILHHVNSFVTEWILIYLYNFLFSVFYLAIYFFTKLLLLTHFLSLSCEKAMLYCFFHIILFHATVEFLFVCLFSFSFFISKKNSLFFFFYPCFNLTRFFEVAATWASSSWSSTFGLQTATTTFGIKSRGGFRLKSWTPVSGLM